MNITANDVDVDELTDIVVNVPADAKGIVIIEIEGVNYTAVIKDGKAVFRNDTGLGVGKYNITAYFGNNKYENKKITMAYALATSDNIYAVKTHLYIGSNKLISFLNKFDVESQNYPSLALGTAEMSLLKLTSIYNTFSRLGVYSDPKTINYINSNNKRYSIKTQKDIKLLNPSTSFIINELLTNTFDTNLGGSINVTGYSIAEKLNVKASAKTGLTDYDSYMIGYTPIYSVGIWTGNIDNSLHTDTFSKNFPKQAFLHIINYLSEENKNIWYDVPNDVYSVFTTLTGFNNNYLKLMYFKR
jgi:membrane peptidoglycan carboxypeptidase